MAGVNKVILVGNLGKDPEVKYLESGSVVANLALATTESYKDKNGNRVENTEWHDLELWDGLAKIAEQYIKKGSKIYVEGRIKSDTWQDDQGNNRKRIRIRVQNLTMLDSKGEGPGGNTGSNPNSMSGNPSPASTSASGGSSVDEEPDDLPF